MLNEKEYLDLKDRAAKHYEELEKITGGKRNCLSAEESATLPKLTNDEISAIEVYEFAHEKPERYYAYCKISNDCLITLNTWTGEFLGSGRVYNTKRSNFGDRRAYFDCKCINGIRYYGIAYIDAGDYCKIKAFKNQ